MRMLRRSQTFSILRASACLGPSSGPSSSSSSRSLRSMLPRSACNVVIEFRNKKGEKASDAEEVHSIALITKTDVGVGRELCWWYGCTDGDAMECKCGWEGCEGMVHL